MNRERYFKRETTIFVDLVLFIWVFFTVLIAYGISYFHIDLSNCVYCDVLSELIPSVSRMPLLTNHHNEAKAVWVFLPISFLLVLYIFFLKINDVNNKALRFYNIIGFILILFTGLLLCIGGFIYTGDDINKEEGFFLSSYRDSLFWMATMSWAAWTCLLAGIFSLTHWFIYLFKK